MPSVQSPSRSGVGGSARSAAALSLAAGLAFTCSVMAAAEPIQQPPGIPMPSETPAPKPGLPGAEISRPSKPGTQPGAKAPGTPPGKQLKGEDYEKLEGHVQDGMFRFGPSSEAVKVKFLIDTILEHAQIKNVIVTNSGVIDKEVYLTQQIVLPVEGLVQFLETILEQNGAVLVKEGDLYFIRSTGDILPYIGSSPLSTTQVIPTLGLRPSALREAVSIALRGGGGVPGQPLPPGGAGGGGPAFLDDLGVIIMTDTPRRIAQVRNMVQLLVEEQSKQRVERFELKYVTASVARQRLLELLGRPSNSGRGGSAADAINAANAAAIAAATGQPGAATNQALSNIADRLIPDPTSNVLIFRGRPDETAFIDKLLKVIDTPNQLRGQFYAVGVLSEQLATLGRGEGLGEIVQLAPTSSGSSLGGSGNRRGGSNGFGEFIQPGTISGAGGQRGTESNGGPMFVLDPEGRGFMYFGTEQQQERVGALARQFSEFAKTTEVVFEFYKLKHARAEDTAEVIRGLISNQVPASGGLLGTNSRDRQRSSTTNPDGSRGSNSSQNNNQRRNSRSSLSGGSGFGGTGGSGGNSLSALTNDASLLQASEDVFVLPDAANNQIVVKAPKQLQKQFEKLIGRLDLRRPQVYLDAKIISISDNDSVRLAFETQLINAGGTGGALNTNFGLGSLTTTSGTTTTGGFTNAKNVATGLGGLTAAIIKSDMVPIVMTAVANTGDTQLLATPQLLVNDNEEAEVSSLDQRPTTTTSIGSAGQQNTQSFSGFEPAGPRLTVTPRISEGNYLALEYDIELSSFRDTTGASSTNGVPPPKQVNRIQSVVTVPSDCTVVVGGLVFEQKDNTVIKIPFIGDIPIIGQLFRDETNSSTRRTLYVFITPKIMRDPGFDDLRLLTRGPSKDIPDRWKEGLPDTKPARMDISQTMPTPPVQATDSTSPGGER